MTLRRATIAALLAALVALPVSAYAAFYYPEAPTPPPPPPTAKTATPAPNPNANKFGLAKPTYVPPGVSAQGVYTTPVTPGSKTTSATYNLDWTIGTAGSSGCLVCHADKNIRTVQNGRVVSLYVDTALLQQSAHAALLCTDCHVDFAYKTPHPNANGGENWRTLAKTACKNCHRTEYLEWAKSAHSSANSPGATSTVGAANSSAPGKPRPLCGDCHAGHITPSKNDTEAMAALHATALTRCGNCHVKAALTYTDYYHGAAYRQGAPDAPACWQCHSTHLALPSRDRSSWTNQDNLDTTCGQCHKAIGQPGAGPGYTQYASFVHRKQATVQSNPIVAMVNKATTAIEGVFDRVISTFRRNGS